MASERAVRPRKALAWCLATFCALQLVLAAAIELRAPWLRDPVYDRKLDQLQSRISAEPAAPLVLALGSSQTFDGFHAELIERRLPSSTGCQPIVYNFGLPGAGPLSELLVLKRLLAEGIRPDLVLLEVTPGLMHGAEQISMSGDRLALGELAISAPFATGQEYFAAVRLLRSLVPFHTHRESLLLAALPEWAAPRRWGMTFQMFDPRGWESIPQTSDAERAVYAKVLADAYRPLLSSQKLDPRSCDCLRQLLDLCRNEQIPTALILMPQAESFAGLYSHEMQTAIDVELAQLEAEFHVPSIDARGWMADADFYDSQHLLATAAGSFSERLAQRLPPLGSHNGALAANPRTPQK